MDIFTKRNGNYWATVSIAEDDDGTFSWQLRLALDANPEESWEVAVVRGFRDVDVASADGMEALSLLDAVPPSGNSSAAEDGQVRTTPLLH